MNGHSDSWCWLVLLFGSEVSSWGRHNLTLTPSFKYAFFILSKMKRGQGVRDTLPSNFQFNIEISRCPPPVSRLSLSVSRTHGPGLTSLSSPESGPGRSRSRVTPPTRRGSDTRSRLSLGSVIIRTPRWQQPETGGVITMVTLTFGIKWRNIRKIFYLRDINNWMNARRLCGWISLHPCNTSFE